MEIKREALLGEQDPAKRIWSTPRVIVSDQPVRNTANLLGGGFDGGINVGTSTAS